MKQYIKEELDTTYKYVQDSYTVAEAKGATLPNSKNLRNLPITIASIRESVGGDYQPGLPVGVTQDWATVVFGDDSKAIQFGTYKDTKSFADSCNEYSNYVNLAIGTQTRDKILSYYVGANCLNIPNNLFNTPTRAENITQFDDLKQFNNLRLISMGSAITISDNFLAGNTEFTGVIEFSEDLTSIGKNFMENCLTFNRDIVLPDSLKTVGLNFLHNCNSLPSLYIPKDAKPPTDRNSLSCDNQNALAYLGGLRVGGPGASKWVTALPNRDIIPFRKLVLTEENGTYHYVRTQFENYKSDDVQAVLEDSAAEEPTPTYIDWYYEHPLVADSANDDCKKPITYELDGYVRDDEIKYKVVLEFENGMKPQTLSLKNEEKIRERFNLNLSTRIPYSDGRKFVGWYKGEPVEILYHRVKVDPGNGEEPRVTQIAHGMSCSEMLRDPEKKRRKFLGWSDEGTPERTITLEMIDDTVIKKVPDGFTFNPVSVLTNETEEGIFIGWEVVE